MMLNWDDPLATPAKPQAATTPASAGEAVQARMPEAEQSPTPAPVIEESLAKVEAEEKVAKPKRNLKVSQPAIMPVAAKPVNPDDKRVVNGMTDINQLAPFKYPWAWEYFLLEKTASLSA